MGPEPLGEMADFKSGAEKADELGTPYTKKCGCYAVKYYEDQRIQKPKE